MNREFEFCFSFLQNKENKFLVNKTNIEPFLSGQSLSKYISFDIKKDKGFPFKQEEIFEISNFLTEEILKEQLIFDLKHYRYKIHLYTICRCQNFDFLLIYSFLIKRINNKRNEWIKDYDVVNERACCFNKFYPFLENINVNELNRETIFFIEKTVDGLCVCPKKIVYVNTRFTGYLLNKDKSTIDLFYDQPELWLTLIPGEIISSLYSKLNFSSKGKFNRNIPNCEKLYQNINKDNMANFLYDCLFTAYNCQNNYFKNQIVLEHQLIYLSIQVASGDIYE